MPRQLYFTNDAYRDLLLEVAEHRETETGGILLGCRDGVAWYVLEVLDPGPRSILQPAYFEYNHDYATHLANKVARRYQRSVELLGLWHRHPGSLDTFSTTDDQTHRDFLQICGRPIVSGLANVDPEFRLTFYEVNPPLQYERIKVTVGDEDFPRGLLCKRPAQTIMDSLRYAPIAPGNSSDDDGHDSSLGNHLRESDTSVVRDASPALDEDRRTGDGECPAARKRSWAASMIAWLPFPFSHARHTTRNLENQPVKESEQCGAQSPLKPRDERPALPRVASVSEKQKILNLLDPELDFLDASHRLFAYRVSPQEPGYRLEVRLTDAAHEIYCAPLATEFVFYPKDGRPTVAINGEERNYYPGIVSAYYNRRRVNAPV